MIARDVEVTDLRPDAWNNLISLVDVSRIADLRPRNPNILSILHQGGRVLRIYAPPGFRVPAIDQVDDPQELAKRLYYQLPGLESVQILDRNSLAHFSDRVQRSEWISADLEGFFANAFKLAGQDPAGLVFFPPYSWKWNGLAIEDIRAWLEAGPDPSAYFLGIIRNAAPWSTLILRVAEKKVRLITTIEFLERFGVPVAGKPASPTDLGAICDAIRAHIAPVRAALLCDYMVFARLLASEDKRRDLTLAIADGSAASVGIPE
jgi:hypothetical protein